MQYTVTAPDGREYEVTAPDHASEAQVLEYAKRQFDQMQGAPEKSWAAQNLPGPVKSLIRGGRDVIDYGAQTLAHGLNSLGVVPDSEVQKVEGINRKAEEDYQTNWRERPELSMQDMAAGKSNAPGIDGWRLAGNIGTNALMFRNVAPAATLPQRMLQAGKIGAVSSAFQPVAEGADNYWLEKGKQAALGFGVGAVATPVIEGVASGARSLLNKGANVIAGKVSSWLTSPEDAVREALKAKGLDFNNLSQQMRSELLQDAEKALNAGGKLDPDAVARMVDFKTLGIKPTLGQVTRDPVQYSKELNLRGLGDAGAKIQSRLNEQSGRLFEHLDDMSGQPATRHEVGEQIMNTLGARDAAMKSRVDDLYGTARKAVGLDTPLNGSRFSNGLNDKLDEMMIGDALPSDVRNTINRIAKGEMPFTVQKAEQIIQNLNGQGINPKSREGLAIRAVKEALDAEIEAAGTQAGQAFNKARQAASTRFKWQDMVPAAKAVVHGEAAPDVFVNRFVLNAKAKDIQNLMLSLPQKDKDILRSQVARHLASKAGADQTGELSAFAQKSFNNEISRLGKERLTALLGVRGFEDVSRIGRVAAFIQKRPPGDAVNESKTAASLGDLGLRFLNLPMLKPILGEPIGNAWQGMQAEKALQGGLLATPRQMIPPLDPAIKRLGLLGAPLVFGTQTAQ